MLNSPHSAALQDLVRSHQLIANWIQRNPEGLDSGAPAGKWTVAEHLLHLLLSLETLAEGLRQPPTKVERSFECSMKLRWALLTFRLGSSLVCPAAWEPRVLLTSDDLMARLNRARDELAERLKGWAGEYPNGETSPYWAMPHFQCMTPDEALRFTLVHVRHHLSEIAN